MPTRFDRQALFFDVSHPLNIEKLLVDSYLLVVVSRYRLNFGGKVLYLPLFLLLWNKLILLGVRK